MSWNQFQTTAEIQASFEQALDNAITKGALCPDGVGIEYETQQALYAVAAASPNVPQGLIDEARHSLINQIQGL